MIEVVRWSSVFSGEVGHSVLNLALEKFVNNQRSNEQSHKRECGGRCLRSCRRLPSREDCYISLVSASSARECCCAGGLDLAPLDLLRGSNYCNRSLRVGKRLLPERLARLLCYDSTLTSLPNHATLACSCRRRLALHRRCFFLGPLSTLGGLALGHLQLANLVASVHLIEVIKGSVRLA